MLADPSKQGNETQEGYFVAGPGHCIGWAWQILPTLLLALHTTDSHLQPIMAGLAVRISTGHGGILKAYHQPAVE